MPWRDTTALRCVRGDTRILFNDVCMRLCMQWHCVVTIKLWYCVSPRVHRQPVPICMRRDTVLYALVYAVTLPVNMKLWYCVSPRVHHKTVPIVSSHAYTCVCACVCSDITCNHERMILCIAMRTPWNCAHCILPWIHECIHHKPLSRHAHIIKPVVCTSEDKSHVLPFLTNQSSFRIVFGDQLNSFDARLLKPSLLVDLPGVVWCYISGGFFSNGDALHVTGFAKDWTTEVLPLFMAESKIDTKIVSRSASVASMHAGTDASARKQDKNEDNAQHNLRWVLQIFLTCMPIYWHGTSCCNIKQRTIRTYIHKVKHMWNQIHTLSTILRT